MSADLEEQKLEILAIQEICEPENVKIISRLPDIDSPGPSISDDSTDFFETFKTQDCDIGGKIIVSSTIPDPPLKVVWKSQKSELNIHHLPPVTIEFVFPQNYPSEVCPEFRLACQWLDDQQICDLTKKLKETWQDAGGCVVLFLWMSFIKDELLDFLEIHSEISISIDEKPPKEMENNNKEFAGILFKFLPKGFGFIKCDDSGKEVFVHISEIKFDRKKLQHDTKPNLKVIFNQNLNPKNNKENATNVRLFRENEANSSSSTDLSKESLSLEEPELVKILKSYQEQAELAEFNKKYFECFICFSEKPGKQCLRFVQCQHVFCNECMKSYFEVQINEGQMSNLICPMDKCTVQALPTQVRALVSPKHYQKYEEILLSTTLETMSDVILCPLQHCQCPTLIDREASMGQCPKCNFAFCIYCKASFHGVAPCRMRSKERIKLLTEYMGADPQTRYVRKIDLKY